MIMAGNQKVSSPRQQPCITQTGYETFQDFRGHLALGKCITAISAAVVALWQGRRRGASPKADHVRDGISSTFQSLTQAAYSPSCFLPPTTHSTAAMSDLGRGLPLLSGQPQYVPSETCRKCSKEFNILFARSRSCNHCGMWSRAAARS